MTAEPLDPTDRRILQVLQDDARITMTELADRVGLSPTPCTRRVKRLEETGVIRRYATLLEPTAVGLPVNVFVSISLTAQTEPALQAVEEAVGTYPEVMECYLMTGDADYLLRVVVPDLETYQRFVMDKLTRLPGIANIRSSFALRQVAYRTALPLG